MSTEQAAVVLVLSKVISANDYWGQRVIPGTSRVTVFVTHEARKFREEVGWIARAAGLRQQFAHRVWVDIKVYPARPQDWAKRTRRDPEYWDDTVRCVDLDNARKVLLDALQGIAYTNDKAIWRDSGERMEPDEQGARVVVTIAPMPARIVAQQRLVA